MASSIMDLATQSIGYGPTALRCLARFLTTADKVQLLATSRALRWPAEGMSAPDALLVRSADVLWHDAARALNAARATWLAWAARRGRFALLCQLCDWGADMKPAMHAAIQENRVDCLREPIARGAAELDYNNQHGGHYPLHEACCTQSIDCMRVLLDHGADIEVAVHGRTAIVYACQSGPSLSDPLSSNLDVVRELIARGANVNAADSRGETALTMASWQGFVDYVRVLLEAGANKRHTQNDGVTTAHLLASAHPDSLPGTRQAVRALLAAAP